jgi:hypothetical protein
MKPVRAIAELPFRRRDPLELLHVQVYRDAPDADYTGFGHARIDELVLEGDGCAPEVVRDALVLAVHSMEDPEALDGDLELEFVMPEVTPDYSVTVLLSDFLRIWLPRVRRDERAVVLVVCNPNQTALRRPPGAGRTPFYYPLGDVESWLDRDHGQSEVCLVAGGGWQRCEP